MEPTFCIRYTLSCSWGWLPNPLEHGCQIDLVNTVTHLVIVRKGRGKSLFCLLDETARAETFLAKLSLITFFFTGLCCLMVFWPHLWDWETLVLGWHTSKSHMGMSGSYCLVCPVLLGSSGSKTGSKELYYERLSVTVPHWFEWPSVCALRLTLVRFWSMKRLAHVSWAVVKLHVFEAPWDLQQG